MKKVLNTIGIGIIGVAIVAIGTNLGSSTDPILPVKVEEEVDQSVQEVTLGGNFASNRPITILGVAPTTTAFTGFNTTEISTTTPTTTSYFQIGPLVDKVDLWLHANPTSSDEKILHWTLETSPLGGQVASSSQPFYVVTSGAIAADIRTWNSASTTDSWTALRNGEHNLIFPLCNNTYDGTDDIPACNAGWYKLVIGKVGFSAFDVNASISAKSFSD